MFYLIWELSFIWIIPYTEKNNGIAEKLTVITPLVLATNCSYMQCFTSAHG